MTGGLGNDIIMGNEGFDALIGNEGDDWIESRGGQGDLMFGDFGAPTGQQPLYSGNDVMIGGVAGGDIMKGFSGDDIMLGHGSFTKFIGGLGFDWGSYELATQGVDDDMNRKEFVAANGAVDTVRDVWQGDRGRQRLGVRRQDPGRQRHQAADAPRTSLTTSISSPAFRASSIPARCRSTAATSCSAAPATTS